ncbi:MAG: hypothetical protein VX047_00645 [Pseudomonadota bacterium]|nr:hypothetical protein [Pseudomonadota bacterium]MEC8089411.1 hypothetical protein [Pseudomonadota bacterium]MEC8244921.1 hypothetical protein [Pseudomonadota bacterium]MEC8539156.1 hypothetical protein [Pseudomonadota bacterium]MEC9145670.1 hypothetical protein [Pseudomonadota bacterium]
MMGYQNVRLVPGMATEGELAMEIRAVYRRARQSCGLRGPAAFHRACEAYACLNPDVPDHLVPKRVAKFLNPNMPVDGGTRQ